MDPQQRLALEVFYEALQTAGQPPAELYGRRVGVCVGSFEGDWHEMNGSVRKLLHPAGRLFLQELSSGTVGWIFLITSECLLISGSN